MDGSCRDHIALVHGRAVDPLNVADHEVRVLDRAGSVVQRRAGDVGDGNRRRAQGRDERDRRALLERGADRRIDGEHRAARHPGGRELALRDPNREAQRAELTRGVVDVRADDLGNGVAMRQDVGPRAVGGPGDQPDDQDGGRPAPPPAALGALQARDRLGDGRGGRRGRRDRLLGLREVADERAERPRPGERAGERRQVHAHRHGRLRTHLAIRVGRARHEAVEVVADLRRRPRRLRHPVRQVLVRDRHRGLARVGELTGEQFVRDDPQRVQVGPRVGRLAADLLGREVLDRARHGARPRVLRVGERTGETEIGELHDAVGRDEDVLGLEVAVDDPFRVRVLEGRERLADDVGRLRGREPPARVQELADRPSADVLHDHVVDAVDRPPVVHRHDVRMVEGGGRAGFAAEPFDEAGVARQRTVEDLDGDLAREDGVVRAEDLAHAPGGDPLQHVIAAVKGHQRVALAVRRGHRLCHALGHRPPVRGSAQAGRSASGGILRPWEPGTVQPLRPTAEETASLRIAEELDSIEEAVRGGSTDLRALGFWRVVGSVKRDQVLVLEHADQVGRIDRAAFVARVRVRAPVWVGSVLLVAVIAAGVVAILLAARWTGTAAGIALLAAAVAWAIGVHSPTHQAFGWFAGIRFTDSFLGGPPPPRPGLKTDYATYLRAEPSIACLVPRLRRDRHQDRAVRRRRAGSPHQRAGVGGARGRGDRRPPDRDRRALLDEDQ